MATIKIGGRPYLDTASAPKIEDLLSVNGALKVYVDSLAAGEDQSLDVQHVIDSCDTYTVTATGTVFSGPGIVKGFTVNAVGTGTTVTVYDNTSATGTAIYISGTLSTVGAVVTFPSDRILTTGLHVVIGGTGSPVLIFDAKASA